MLKQLRNTRAAVRIGQLDFWPEELLGCPGGTDVAEKVREGGEAEARRGSGGLQIRQFAVLRAVCSSSSGGRVGQDGRSSEAR